ncbi:MAG: methyltransferase family protein [Anaerolineales bacterium]
MKLTLYLILFLLYFAHDFGLSFRFSRKYRKAQDFLGKNAPGETQRFFGLATVLVMGYYVLALVYLATGFSFWGLISEIVVLNTPFVQTIGFSIGILSLLLMTLARLNLRSSWRVGLDYATTDALVMDGFYRYIRNPYFAFLLAFQFSLMLVSPSAITLCALIQSALLLGLQSRQEEQFLQEKYGAEFEAYRAATGRFFPRLFKARGRS